MPSQWGSDQLPTASARWGIPTTLLIKDCQSLRQCFQISPAYNVPKNLCFIKVDPDFFVPQLWTKNCFWATSDLKNMILGLFCHVVYNPKDFLKILDAQITPSKGRILKNAMLDGSFDFKSHFDQLGIQISGLVPNARAKDGDETRVNHSWRFMCRRDPWPFNDSTRSVAHLC